MKNVAIITGASSGIGLAVANELLNLDHKIYGLSRYPNTIKHKNYEGIAIDFKNNNDLMRLLPHLKKTLPPANLLMLNAGFGLFKELEQFSYQEMIDIMQVNFTANAMVTQTLLPAMKAQKSGHIVIIGSECARAGDKKATLYAASKFALRGFAQCLQEECRNVGIKVTLINPGLVDTPFFENLNFCPFPEKNSAIQVEEIAFIIKMLLNPKTINLIEEINLRPLKKAGVIKK